MDELLMLAETMGVSVEWEDILPAGWVGVYCAVAHAVYILRGMSRARTRTVLAHELGHAHYRHTGRRTADEWHADLWAAGKLLDPARYFEAMRDGPSTEELARRMDTTPHMIRVAYRAGRGPSKFGAYQPVKLREGLTSLGPLGERPMEPRRLTRMMPVVPAAAPRVTVSAIPRELVPA